MNLPIRIFACLKNCRMKSVRYTMLLACLILMAGCQVLPEDDDFLASDENVLKVNTRSVEGAEIIYPLNLYAFAKDGSCADSQKIDDAEEEMALVLENGSYQIVAVSGISESYQLPEEPSQDDVITLSGEYGADTPLMVGKASVNVGKAEASVDITLSNVVVALNVALKGIPADVEAVTLTLSPLYSSLSMDGEYGGESQSVQVNCSLDSDQVWSAPVCYIFPGLGSETVFSILLEKEDGIEATYGYTYQGIPEANRPFNVSGNYLGGVTVGGNLIAQNWKDPIEVEFDFGAEELSDDTDEDEDELEVDLTGVPEVGSIWNGTIVADIGESDVDGVDLLLMSLEEWNEPVSQAENVIAGYSVNGISGWRLPTNNEAKVLRSYFNGDKREALNERIADYEAGLLGIDGEERYLCDKSGKYYTFKFVENARITEAGSKRSYYIRLVKTYRWLFEEEEEEEEQEEQVSPDFN